MPIPAMPIAFSLIAHGSAAYRAALALREEILRAPLGLTLTAEETAGEAGYLHIGAFEGERLVGCLMAVPLEDGLWRLRQVAVEEKMQGQGVGSAMTRFAEAQLRGRGAQALTLKARITAVPFYEKLGYQAQGEEFLEKGIAHVTMEKIL